ncbi:MFS transporter [Aeromicrobium marinum]|uniref:MFS transporter n=1 Tax=Aeromicrobium marinum TaxID=219314 RepID=UPI00058DA6E7|nr:MFS transporter [Aeromicrobium marinum]
MSATSPAVGLGATPAQVRAWSLWDWGSAAFNAVIVTFVFSVYLTDSVGEDLEGPISASTWLAWAVGAGGLVIAVLAPVTGQRADAAGRRKRSLAVLTFTVVALTALMFLVEDDPSFLWLGLVLISVGVVVFELAQVPYFAMLRQVSTPATVGRVSGVGWAYGYLGGIVLLLICYFGFVVGDGGLFGLPTENGFNIRLIALLAAGWFLVFSLPLLFRVPELPAEVSPVDRTGFLESYRVLWRDVVVLWGEDRRTVLFLVASALYRDGLAGVFTFGAILAVSVYDIGVDDVLIFGVAANVVAAAASVAAGRIDDRLGPRVVVTTSLAAMLVVATVLLFVDGPLMFWIFGLLLTLFVGPAQTASRTFLMRLTPVGREGQFFGLYAMTGKAASFLSPVLFGLFVLIGGDDRWGIIGIMLVLGAGLALLLTLAGPTGDRADEVVA